MAFKDVILTFEDDKIITDDDREVMMSWEAPIMEKSAGYICQSKGDILEIGFGMGICSDYIQVQNVKSHTIVEIHPQVIEKLKIWAEDKDNVIIVEGNWNDVELETYDGIFIDTYGGENWNEFKEFALSKGKSGANSLNSFQFSPPYVSINIPS
jgi:protein arginine N-methyltransferase 2